MAAISDFCPVHPLLVCTLQYTLQLLLCNNINKYHSMIVQPKQEWDSTTHDQMIAECQQPTRCHPNRNVCEWRNDESGPPQQ